MLWPKKKIHTRNLITKKIPAARKFPYPSPPPPAPAHNFSNGLFLKPCIVTPFSIPLMIIHRNPLQ